ncbi:MAG TPA: hypothetical protein VI544_00355 [Candidatus Nanoarchaeia archaeon]|nr:hypothetical protein [Candidatus Nanoarchaeia archaeon]
MEKIKVGFGNKKIIFSVKRLSYANYWIGLMFKTKNSENLLFDLPGKWGIHSFFVFFPFLALWLDEKNKIMEWKIVKPFSFFVKPRKRFSKLIEIPINNKNEPILSIFRR